MMRFGELITKQSNLLLQNKRHASACAALFALLPLASWLSVALVALVALRKGAKAGFEVLLPALVFHAIPMIMMVPLDGALLNTAITYLPCYFAALILRQTASWQLVFGFMFFLALVVSVLIQSVVPDFAMNQLNQLNTLLSQHQDYSAFMAAQNDALSPAVMAQLFLGIQMLGAMVFTTLSLLCARALQAKLFIPGGFIKEVKAFRSGKLSLAVLIAIALAAYYEMAFGINLLPLVLSYFLLSGFCLVFLVLAQRGQRKVTFLLVLLILLKPAFVLFAYIVFGSLDSLFNFRVYLPKRVRELT